ncbi:hypothetical protein [Lacihabitans lacunae]|uniref:CRISPR-associated protein n=1 Tax=Lacihabitans lacunae TaxID=1028214 RepID=A0ABV7YRH4_9BACT
MLLNLTNHPSSQWSQKQFDFAIELYKNVVDLSFPLISPDLNSDSLDLVVKEFEAKVREMNPKAVHIMGEMTFTYRMVKILKKAGFTCLASTTERTVIEEKDIKTSTFSFVQFREY